MTKIRWSGKLAVLVAATLVCVLFAGGVALFISRYYIPVREVRPILKLLENGKPEDVEAAELSIRGLCYQNYPNGRSGMVKAQSRILLRGSGAQKVKQAMLKEMASSNDSETLRCMFTCVMSTMDERVLSFNNAEWEIIRKATDRFNAKQKYGAPNYFPSKDTNGLFRMDFSGQVSD